MTNIAFAGLTAAGKTTHAQLLAEQLGYTYVSATQLLLSIVGVDDTAPGVWFRNFTEIEKRRQGDSADEELERQLLTMAANSDNLVLDTWALAWIAPQPMIRLWIESDEPSRVRKCLVSQSDPTATMEQCQELITRKDGATRTSFLRRHSFDLFRDRERYDLILDNSNLIPRATKECAATGISKFAPVVMDCVTELLEPNRSRQLNLLKDKYRPYVRKLRDSTVSRGV